MPSLIDLTGMRFGAFTVIRRSPLRASFVRWECVCDCGQVLHVVSQNLRLGRSKSCGCVRDAATVERSKTHGLTGTAEHRTLVGIIARCENPNVIGFRNYGGRGISVCDRWRKGEGGKTGTELFLADMGPRPSPNHSIDRIDVNGDYCPANCRWATPKQQATNKADTRYIWLNGRRVPLTDAALHFDRVVHYETAWGRIKKGWTTADAFTTPPTVPGRPRRHVAQQKVAARVKVFA